MREEKMLGMLLKKIPLANDDGVLTFLTDKYGVLTVFAPRFFRSKIRQRDVDFFRVLELEVFQGRNSRKLRGATMMEDFRGFMTTYAASEVGFGWLKGVSTFLPEEKVFPGYWEELVVLMMAFEAGEWEVFEGYFWAQLLWVSGWYPRWEGVREDGWFVPETGELSVEKLGDGVFIPNETRQVLVALGRWGVEEFLEKRGKLPKGALMQTLQVLDQLQQVHG